MRPWCVYRRSLASDRWFAALVLITEGSVCSFHRFVGSRPGECSFESLSGTYASLGPSLCCVWCGGFDAVPSGRCAHEAGPSRRPPHVTSQGRGRRELVELSLVLFLSSWPTRKPTSARHWLDFCGIDKTKRVAHWMQAARLLGVWQQART